MKIEHTITVDGLDYKFDYISSCYFFEELLGREDITTAFAAEMAPLLTEYYIDNDMLTLEDVIEQVNDTLDSINSWQNKTFDSIHADKIIKILYDKDDYLAETLFGTKED